MNKVIRPHGMSSEKARRVKLRGHRKEYLYASLIGGKVIKGTKKPDVMDAYGKIHSIKGGGEIKRGEGRKGKWQIFLHKISRFERDSNFYGRTFFINILKTYPKTYNEYQNKKEETKKKIIPYMKELKTYLSNSQNKYNFFNKAFFDEKVDYFVIYHDDIFYVYDYDEILKIFVKTLLVKNNKTFQKVVFEYEGKIIAEIEVRTTNDGKYPSILFNMQKLRTIELLEKEIKLSKKLTPVIIARGKAINSKFLVDKK